MEMKTLASARAGLQRRKAADGFHQEGRCHALKAVSGQLVVAVLFLTSWTAQRESRTKRRLENGQNLRPQAN